MTKIARSSANKQAQNHQSQSKQKAQMQQQELDADLLSDGGIKAHTLGVNSYLDYQIGDFK